ncbi:patatin-like phospholipase family protein [Antarcticirhabdus aurantiaca]|uniref:Patatin-like phospholipase family protein n=1 Tax=Antarcticirhabdus aurantiaca TaxID=2606717 RepID=A0ACD4NLD0_9HYPH|nr:patatin-like phospholipase family protein [Antarcticirhabdus aurantiaca]WAJ27702.1 patatin-like phospholipase family protein [Jeongeuplla avenae]
MAPTLGLALGGGGARGLAHIPVFEALDELGVRPAVIAGTSIGAILGAAYAAGMSGAEIREAAVEAFANKRLVLARLWRTRPPNLAAFRSEGGLRLGQINAARLLEAFLPEHLPRDFSGLAIPFAAIATDFYAGEPVVIEHGDLFSAIAASAALPAVFRPVMRDGRLLVDGGFTDPLPFEALAGRADRLVAVDVTGGPKGEAGAIPTPLAVLTGASQIMAGAIIRAKLRAQAPDLVLTPAVSDWGVLDFLRTRTIIDATLPFREEAKRAIAAVMEGDAGGSG